MPVQRWAFVPFVILVPRFLLAGSWWRPSPFDSDRLRLASVITLVAHWMVVTQFEMGYQRIE